MTKRRNTVYTMGVCISTLSSQNYPITSNHMYSPESGLYVNLMEFGYILQAECNQPKRVIQCCQDPYPTPNIGFQMRRMGLTGQMSEFTDSISIYDESLCLPPTALTVPDMSQRILSEHVYKKSNRSVFDAIR